MEASSSSSSSLTDKFCSALGTGVVFALSMYTSDALVTRAERAIDCFSRDAKWEAYLSSRAAFRKETALKMQACSERLQAGILAAQYSERMQACAERLQAAALGLRRSEQAADQVKRDVALVYERIRALEEARTAQH